MGELLEKLKQNGKSAIYPFHMPGHKRNVTGSDPYEIDITEIEGFDDFHKPDGIIKKLNERAAEEYGADRAWILVNGSSSGILAALSASVRPGETVLMARNCHKSAYNAVMLRKIKAEYIYPQTDIETGINYEIKVSDVEKKLGENNNIRAVIITSPTYEGVISDINEIAQTVHSHNAVLIVDCAHGAHLGVGKNDTVNPLSCGADIVVMSLHKTLPSMTQTAVMCVNGNSADCEALNRYIDIYTSTSPSYVLMASVERCFDIIDMGGKSIWEKYYSMVRTFRTKCNSLKHLYLWKNEGQYDDGKIVISCSRSDINGHELMQRLRAKYGLELEMESAEYVIAMTSICDEQTGFDRLYSALREIDDGLTEHKSEKILSASVAEKKYEAYETEYLDKDAVFIEDACGKISGGYMYAYPPGIPISVPGEIVTKEVIDLVKNYEKAGIAIRGVKEGKIKIIGEK